MPILKGVTVCKDKKIVRQELENEPNFLSDSRVSIFVYSDFFNFVSSDLIIISIGTFDLGGISILTVIIASKSRLGKN